jgi:hypothetical protein
VLSPDSHTRVFIPLHNQAHPVIAATVSRDSDGLYVYNYAVSTSVVSRKPLWRWSILMPAQDERLVGDGSPGWRLEHEGTGMVDQFAATGEPLKYVHFTAEPGFELPVAKGVVSLRLVSQYSPGYVSSFARSRVDRELPASALLSLPEPVRKRVADATQPHWDAQLRLVVGPRYRRSISKRTVAAGMLYAVQHFVSRNDLDSTSDFARTALESLKSYTSAETLPPDADGMFGFLPAARTAKEKELADTIRMSLIEQQ